MNMELLKQLLLIAITLSVLITATIQKIKSSFNFKKTEHITICSFVLNIVLAICFCKSFTDVNLLNSLWVGLFSFIGADTLYKAFEDKLTSYSEIVSKRETTRETTQKESE